MMQHLEQKLIRAAKPYTVVAFDIFDTLLFRDVSAPTDLFFLMEQTGQAPAGFARNRLAAEKAARSSGREVTLEEIYAQATLEGTDPQAEIQAELDVCVPNRPLLRAAKLLHEQGKTIYAISDMYLSADVIQKMLRRCGFDFLKGVYVSSEYGVQKRSGKLFRLFLKDTGLSASQVLFVGNDRRADIVGSALAGIRSFLVPPPAPLTYLPAAQNWQEGAFQAFVRNRVPESDRWDALGFSLLGPLLTSFAVWLHETFRPEESHRRLMFLARDMYLVRQIYAELYGSPTEYLRVSRRSLCPALLQRPMTEEGLALLADALPRQVLKISQVLEYCGFNTSFGMHGVDLERTVDLRSRPLTASVQEQLLGLAALGKTTAGVSVREQAEQVRAYLKKAAIKQDPPILVDIGSGGTTQRILESLCGAELQGVCLACDERLHQTLPPERADAFLFGGAPAPLWYWVGQPMLEQLISEPCGATVGYTDGAQGPMPVLEEVRPDERILRLQSGVLHFARAWKEGPWRDLPLPADRLADAYLSLVRCPEQRDIRELGSLTVEDGESWSLAAPGKWQEYITHPKGFVQDFRQARWKNAFLKRAFRLPFPYAKLYEFLKKRQGGG